MRDYTSRLLLAGLFSVCLTGTTMCAGLPREWKDTRDVAFVLNQPIPVNFLIQGGDFGRIEVPWVRIEPTFGNAWTFTACVGWSPAADSIWQIRIDLLDDKATCCGIRRTGPRFSPAKL